MTKPFSLLLNSTNLIILAAGLASPGLVSSSRDIGELGLSIIQEGTAAVSCDNQRLLALAGMDYDACVANAEVATKNCFERIRPIIPDLQFGTSKFLDQGNQSKLASTLFALEKCVQASILLSGDGQDQEVRGRQPKSKTKAIDPHLDASSGDNSGIAWANVIEKARVEFVESPDLLSRLSSALTAHELTAAIREEDGSITGFRDGPDGERSTVSKDLQLLDRIFADQGVRFAAISDVGINVGIHPEYVTNVHCLDVSYKSSLKPALPKCDPNMRDVPCGSCEIDRTGNGRAVLTWSLKEVGSCGTSGKLEGAVADFSVKLKKLTQCWKDGMSELGFDLDAPLN